MRVAVVNRFYPPDTAITGVSAAELVKELAGRLPDAEFRVFASAASYPGGVDADVSDLVRIDRIHSHRMRGGKIGRLASSLVEGMALARRAVAWADIVISLTDPPLLGYWIGHEIARQGRRIGWLEWTMDIYPEAFRSAGLVGEQNLAYRHVINAVRRHLPDAYLSLGPAQARAIAAWRMTDKPAFVLPCGIIDGLICGSAEPPFWRVDEDRVILAYAGNLGAAHCPALLRALVDAADPSRFLFVFALYGAHADRIRTQLVGQRNIVWVDRLTYAELAHADVHIASLRPEWTHVCVPSKAVSTVCLGRPLLFAGDPGGDTAGLLGDAAWLIDMPSHGIYDDGKMRALLEQICDAGQRYERGRRARWLSAQLASTKAAVFDDLAAWLAGANRSLAMERAA